METARSYELQRRPAAVELDGGETFDMKYVFIDALERVFGSLVVVEEDDRWLILPPPFEVWRDGRTLRGEEYDEYANACLAAASEAKVRSIRYAIEEMYTFDWSRFTSAHDEQLRRAYASLPGWMNAQDLPRWFGSDERKGPSLSASMEPPGLQVYGILEPAVFDAWHARFIDATRALPVRPMDAW